MSLMCRVSTQRQHIMDMLQNTEGQLQKKLVDPILELTEGLEKVQIRKCNFIISSVRAYLHWLFKGYLCDGYVIFHLPMPLSGGKSTVRHWRQNENKVLEMCKTGNTYL